MKLSKLCDVELRYTALESLDYDVGGQLHGTMDGRVAGERLSGSLRLTNLAPRRPDNVNLPTLRGVLTTDDGAAIWVELDGIATLREADRARAAVMRSRIWLISTRSFEPHAPLGTVSKLVTRGRTDTRTPILSGIELGSVHLRYARARIRRSRAAHAIAPRHAGVRRRARASGGRATSCRGARYRPG